MSNYAQFDLRAEDLADDSPMRLLEFQHLIRVEEQKYVILNTYSNLVAINLDFPHFSFCFPSSLQSVSGIVLNSR